MKNRRPLVSVYTSVYNNHNLVIKSLRSVKRRLDCLRISYEIVIYDDGSFDGTYGLITKYAMAHKNIKIIRGAVNKGRGFGRGVAYKNTAGKLVFYVDLDTIYLPPLSKLVKWALEHYKTGEIFYGIMDRKTMDRIGGWKNLIMAEDVEFYARAISRGIKIYWLPCRPLDEITTGSREKRYSRSFLNFVARSFRIGVSSLEANGITKVSQIKANDPIGVLKLGLCFLYIKLSRKHSYAYSKKYTNSELFAMNVKFMDPKKLGINPGYYVEKLNTRYLPKWLVDQKLEELKKLGMGRYEKQDKNRLLVFSNKTYKWLLEHERKFK